ncbi:MAG: hypothetical protein DWB56_14500 [Candidatus Jettenia sp.]|uniref:PIN domain-containing protein n=1 Tax=Candidatus Jettenia caeni TaxID=247490 RepID=I3IPC5_9BACT|nr:hypothetical protein [Candidatus Jettenia sp. AMX1]MBC6930143.1 hypothetical protein [Candidatus Jettenia sp.]NUN22446.1 hypothetical protein [Candidatus Jettenia caeni]KAA0248590.1 MAG: hypothetical protein EDM77_11865 [Candidatus Jettenia sp. AMX1]MCE7881550.1 hypothetical protein [Candidatus Jettenia sp. AMX1]MCQ3927735.1 hypothetical protein [Candidatus Jettenia sp.]
MLTNFIFIDTNIWYYAYVIPKRLEFVKIHNRAVQFLTEKLEDANLIIAITTHQIAEILDVLRKSNLSVNIRKDILESFKTPKFHIVNLTIELIEASFYKSLSSDIHIYDYLCAYLWQILLQKFFLLMTTSNMNTSRLLPE